MCLDEFLRKVQKIKYINTHICNQYKTQHIDSIIATLLFTGANHLYLSKKMLESRHMVPKAGK